jgi:hypothetical protein
MRVSLPTSKIVTPLEKVGSSEADGRDVKNIPAAAGIVIKIGNRVPAVAGPEHENVVVPAAHPRSMTRSGGWLQQARLPSRSQSRTGRSCTSAHYLM